GIRAVIPIRIAPAPAPAPEREATKAADEGDIIEVIIVMMPIATPIAATPMLATPMLATPMLATPIAATPTLAATPMLAATPITAWPGRDYRSGQRHRNKATEESYGFCIHRLLQLYLQEPSILVGPRSHEGNLNEDDS